MCNMSCLVAAAHIHLHAQRVWFCDMPLSPRLHRIILLLVYLVLYDVLFANSTGHGTFDVHPVDQPASGQPAGLQVIKPCMSRAMNFGQRSAQSTLN